MNEVSVSRDIDALPERVWQLVADITRMGDWSPESTGGHWLGGATGPAVGARFKGSNRNGIRRWRTAARVTACEPGREFTFDVSAVGFGVSRWRYTFEPTDNGCRVTETWIDRRGRLMRALGKPVSGVGDRAVHNKAGMEQTLQRLADATRSR